MNSFESRLRSLEVFEAHRENRLRGRDLNNARGAGYNLLVAYEHNALAFDTIVTEVGRTISGAHITTLAVQEPEAYKGFYVTLKGRGGVISASSLREEGKLKEFGGEPKEAILHEDLVVPNIEIKFTSEDEEQFQALYGVHNRRQISMHAGAFGVAPQIRGRLHGK